MIEEAICLACSHYGAIPSGFHHPHHRLALPPSLHATLSQASQGATIDETPWCVPSVQAIGQGQDINVAEEFGCATTATVRLEALLQAIRDAQTTNPQAARAVYFSTAKNLVPVLTSVKTACATGQCPQPAQQAASDLGTVIQQVSRQRLAESCIGLILPGVFLILLSRRRRAASETGHQSGLH